MNKNSIRKTERFQGFKSLNPVHDPYQNILDGTYNEMMLRQQDRRMWKVKEGVRGLRLHSFMKNVETGGPWDHKPVIKQYAPSFYHKTQVNDKGKPVTVFGTAIPGDNAYIYDHDIWSNIHYGYAGRMTEISQKMLNVGARAHDYLSAVKRDAEEFKGWKLSFKHFFETKANDEDKGAVQLGIKLFDKYRTNLTKADLQREIFENRASLNRHKRTILIEKLHYVVKGDTIFNIAKQNNIAAEEILKKNPDLKDFANLKPGTVLEMPNPREIKQLSLSDVKGILSCREYLYGKGPVHEKLVEIIKQHFDAVSENSVLVKKIRDEMDKVIQTPTGTTYYIWQTCGDSSVRGAHAEREGQVFCWENPPEGGNPGEDYNCRCIAVPYDPNEAEAGKEEPAFDIADFVPPPSADGEGDKKQEDDRRH